MKHAWTRGEAWGKGTAAALGGPLHLVVAVVFAGAVLTRLGVDESLAAATGVLLGVPAGALAVALALLARDGRRAWLLVGGGAAFLSVLAAAAVFL